MKWRVEEGDGGWRLKMKCGGLGFVSGSVNSRQRGVRVKQSQTSQRRWFCAAETSGGTVEGGGGCGGGVL
ncbi:hypothetical protein Hanom_Chr09g00812511 [Helianthus anomalus]